MIYHLLLGIINVIFAVNIMLNSTKLYKNESNKSKKEDLLRSIYNLVITNVCINLICILMCYATSI